LFLNCFFLETLFTRFTNQQKTLGAFSAKQVREEGTDKDFQQKNYAEKHLKKLK